MIYKQCNNCGRPVKYPAKHCEQCAKIVEARQTHNKRVRDRHYNKRRDPKYLRFYNSADWKRLSQAYMQDRAYRCERCGQVATEVHHIEPIQTKDGWHKRLDYNNLMAVCVKCHNKEHNRF